MAAAIDPTILSSLHLTGEQYRVILAHCYDGLPDEACGLLAGPVSSSADPMPTGEISSVHPCANAAKSSKLYRIDGGEYLRAERAAASGHEIVGAWHSHTHTDAYPSPTDVEQALGIQSLNGTWVFPIVSLKYDEPLVRVYVIDRVDGGITEIPVVVTDLVD